MTLPSPRLTDHDVLVFDVYGTLVDWESPIHDAFAPVFPHLSREDVLLRYAQVEARLQSQFPSVPYATLLELAYRQLTADHVADDEGSDAARRFGQSIPTWKPFPDTISALHRLKKHFALVVLSNVDERSFAGTHAALCLDRHTESAYPTLTPDSPFALVLTAERVGAYKPDSAMLACALRQLSADPDPSLPALHLSGQSADSDRALRVLVVANSIHHDIRPATLHGLRSVWISRHGANVIGNERERGVDAGSERDDHETAYTWRYETLGELADAVEQEAQDSDVV